MLNPLDFMDALPVDDRRGTGAVDPDEIRATVEAWRSPWLTDDEAFTEYLRHHGLTTTELVQRLTPGHWEPGPGALDWVERLNQMVSAAPYQGALAANVGSQRFEQVPFDGFVRPFVGWLLGVVAVTTDHDDSSVLRPQLAEYAAAAVLNQCIRPLAAESARSGFESGLVEVGAREEFLIKYPVAALDIVRALGDAASSIVRILESFVRDRDDLLRNGFIGTGELIRVRAGVGDTHHRGQSVAILVTTGGTVVFRPHDCGAFAAARRIGEVVGATHVPRSMNRAGYGWVEFAHHDGRASEAYYEQFGSLVGLAWTCGSRDLHLENVVATSAGPKAVDVETFFSAPPTARNGSAAQQLATEWLNASVMGAGLLPVVAATSAADLDVSALTGGLESVRGEVEAYRRRDDGTMVTEMTSGNSGARQNQPVDSTKTTIAAHRAAITRGFVERCGALRSSASEVLAILDASAFHVRIVVRPTRIYALLQHEVRHPSYLRSMLARENQYNRLYKYGNAAYVGTGLVHHEVDQLLRGDIPYFSVRSDGTQLVSDLGPTGSVCGMSPRDLVETRLRGLAPARVATQLELIEDSVGCAVSEPGEGARERPWDHEPPSGFADALLDSLIQKYVSNAVVGTDDATWIGMASSTNSGILELRPVGPGLFDGLAGVSTALVSAAAVRPKESAAIESLARRALTPVVAELDRWCDSPRGPVGAFSGAAGFAYAVAHYELGTGDDTWRPAVQRFVRVAAESAADDSYLDLSSGIAGALAVGAALRDAEMCSAAAFDHLVGAATERLRRGAQGIAGTNAIGWPVGDSRVALGGFSHGATGIAWALARASVTHGECAELAERGLLFDDLHLDERTGLWKDLRAETGDHHPEALPVHWCHGAGGIALGRKGAGAALGSTTWNNHAHVAAERLAIAALPPNDSLCHGAPGNAIILQDVLGANHPTVAAYWGRTLGAVAGDKPVPGLGFPVRRAPGLMVGHAGLMYALARFSRPDLVPNVLALELGPALQRDARG